MKMKKICALVLSLALTTAAVSGCGSSKKDTASAGSESTAAVSSAASESEATAASAAAETETAVTETVSAVESIVEEAVGQAAETAESAAEEVVSAAEEIADSVAEEVEAAVSAVEDIADSVVEEVEAATSVAEEIADSVAEEVEAAVSAVEEIVDSAVEDIAESVAEEAEAAVSVAEEIESAESLVEDIIVPVSEEDVSIEAGEEENPDRSLVNGDPAFTAAWRQLSDALTDGYTKLYEIPEAVKAIPRESAYRISLDPDSLNLLGLASETMLKTDLSWVEEIGIDVVSVAEPYEYSMNTAALYYPGGMSASEYLGMGSSAVLHVNGQEILTADMLLDEPNQLFRLRLPELVSGEYMEPGIMRDYISSIRDMASGYGIRVLSYTPMSTAWQVATGIDRALPEPELFREILATEDPLFDNFRTTDGGIVSLSAGAVSEDCHEVTGIIEFRELVNGAELLLDRIEEDEAFRTEIIEFLDKYHDEFNRRAFSELLGALRQSSLLRGPDTVWLNRLDPYYLDEDLSAMVAFLTGKWEFREGALDEAAARAAEAEADTESDESEEEIYDPRQLTVRPGMALTRTAYEALPYEQVSLMRQAMRRGDVLLTQEYTFGEKLYAVYGYYSGDFREAIRNAAEDIPENVFLELVGSFDEAGTLAGLRGAGLMLSESTDAEMTESAAEELPEESRVREEFRIPLFAAAWPKEGENRACSFTLEEFPGSRKIEAFLEELKDEASGKQEVKASFAADGEELFAAEMTVDPENGAESCDITVCDNWGVPVFTVNALHATDESGTETYTATVVQPGSEEPAFALKAARTPEDTKDVWTGSIRAEGEEYGTLNGYYDWANGETVFDVSVPMYGDTFLKTNLKGTIDLESGDGDLHISMKDETVSEWGSYSDTQLDLDLGMEGMKLGSDGNLQGKMSLTGDVTGMDTENPIPKGMTLFLDFDAQTAKIGDASGTYVTYTILDESEYMPYERARARILEMCGKENVRMLYSGSDHNGLGNNWNILLPVNRLLKAGMPQDFLKELSSNEDVQDIIDEIMYEFS